MILDGPFQQFKRNGYTFAVDTLLRTRHVFGPITLRKAPRSKAAQANAGKPDRRSSDQGGHYVARRFNGPRDYFNHFAQDGNFNRSGYARLENRLERAARSGSKVFLDIVAIYDGASQRPVSLHVTYKTDGATRRVEFENEADQ